MFVTELAMRVSSRKVVINSMGPGMVKTNIAASILSHTCVPINPVISFRGRMLEQGA